VEQDLDVGVPVGRIAHGLRVYQDLDPVPPVIGPLSNLSAR
jgi:hypothetical protein